MKTEAEIIQIVKDSVHLKPWVVDARLKNKHLNALVYGKGYHELLINQIEKIESESRKTARKKYSIDVRDLFHRVMEPRQNVFSADGDSEIFSEKLPKATKKELTEILEDFKGGKSIDEYLSKYLFKFSDVDPNGLIFMEYIQENGQLKKVYPTYKSIQDIQSYHSNGMLVDWVVFKQPQKPKDSFIRYRYVDKDVDVIVTSGSGGYVIFEDDLKKNDFGIVPAVILSDVEEVGTNTRLSWLYFIEELAKKYARDRSIKTLYEFLQGFPKHWIYANFDAARRGGGEDGADESDKSNIMGQSLKPDVTDEIILPVPEDKEYDVKVAPDVGGYISPDLETLKWMSESGADLEELIEYTMWGTQKTNRSGNETATGRWIDTQPLQNKLHVFSDFSQSVHNLMVDFVIRLINKTSNDENPKDLYFRSYGRRFIIEGPDVLIEKYNEARGKGAPSVILDRMLNEWITSKYKNIPELRHIEVLKSQVETYLHLSIEEVERTYMQEGVNKKVLFPIWWEEEAIKTKSSKDLRIDFDKYAELNKTVTNKTEII